MAKPNAVARRVLIIGAGDAGERVVQDMWQNPAYDRLPVAFIDDDPKKRSSMIHDVPVLGSIQEIEAIINKVRPDEILIAIPSATQVQTRGIIAQCKPFGLPIKTLPGLADLFRCRVSVTQIRSLDIEDLIGRPEIILCHPEMKTKIAGKRVLVTGAGGSIGSEICRQVAALYPETLILLEQNENNLHHIQIDLTEKFPSTHMEIVLGDILDQKRLELVFVTHRPQVIFHAAAYKHVPMMEAHPLKAVQNNILGAYQVMMMADCYQADEFVLLSTDKAVCPASVMGATKRVAEMLSQFFNLKSKTKFMSVRFGNVMESNGSVVPLFREQIKKGGPVRVTHPNVERYFITIKEAVQLVLHTAILGTGGEVFVLDMGKPIKIIDIARTMITLSGFSPDQDIPVEFIGLRPGEKLTETLFEKGEEVIQTRFAKIKLVQNRKIEQDMVAYMEKFTIMDDQTDTGQIKRVLKELVPTYSV